MTRGRSRLVHWEGPFGSTHSVGNEREREARPKTAAGESSLHGTADMAIG